MFGTILSVIGWAFFALLIIVAILLYAIEKQTGE